MHRHAAARHRCVMQAPPCCLWLGCDVLMRLNSIKIAQFDDKEAQHLPRRCRIAWVRLGGLKSGPVAAKTRRQTGVIPQHGRENRCKKPIAMLFARCGDNESRPLREISFCNF